MSNTAIDINNSSSLSVYLYGEDKGGVLRNVFIYNIPITSIGLSWSTFQDTIDIDAQIK